MPRIHVWMPDELVTRIVAHGRALGLDRSSAIRLLVLRGLDGDAALPALPAPFPLQGRGTDHPAQFHEAARRLVEQGDTSLTGESVALEAGHENPTPAQIAEAERAIEALGWVVDTRASITSERRVYVAPGSR